MSWSMTGQNDARGTPDDPWISVAVALVTLRISMETRASNFVNPGDLRPSMSRNGFSEGIVMEPSRYILQ
jgi:hypothetical protein